MFQYIEKLRQRPSYTRRRIAFFITLSLFVLVVLLWWITLDINQAGLQDVGAEEKSLSPFNALKGIFSDIPNDVNVKTGVLKNPLYNGN